MSESQPPEIFAGYPVSRAVWTIAGEAFELAWPADMDALLDDPRTQRRFTADGYMPYWAQPWPASVMLVEAILAGPDGAGRSAIEIGCGIGLVSLAAARKGWQVTATDYDEDALAFVKLNAERNAIRLGGAELLDYRQPRSEPGFEAVFGSDLVYERAKCEPVARWIASALLPNGVAWLSDPNRGAAESFPPHVRDAGLCIAEHPVETRGPTGLVHCGRIWRITRSPA